MRYVPSVDVQTTPIPVLATLQRGQAVHSGDLKGILIGVTKAGTIVVAWRDALARKSCPLDYLAKLARYVKANKAPRGNPTEALAYLSAQARAPHMPDPKRMAQALSTYRHACDAEQRTRKLGLARNAEFHRTRALHALSNFVSTFGF